MGTVAPWYDLAYTVQKGFLTVFNHMTATAFEIILFGFVIYKAITSSSERKLLKRKVLLADVMIHENVLYFAL